MVILRPGIGDDLDARADAIAIRFHSMECDVEPVTYIRAAVHPQFSVLVEAGGHDIDAAVALEIAERASAMTGRGSVSEASFAGERLPFAAGTEVAKDNVGFGKLVTGRPH